MTTPKPFAKLFTHATIGQLLVQRSLNEDDLPGVRITFDPGHDDLDPCDVFLVVKGVDDETAEKAADELFELFDEDKAVASVQTQIELIQKWSVNPTDTGATT